MLTGSASDANGDALTYNWEEFDLGRRGRARRSRDQAALLPLVERDGQPDAHVPAARPNLLANTTPKGEILPNVTRTLNFRMTVRDNRAGGGGVAYATLRRQRDDGRRAVQGDVAQHGRDLVGAARRP